MNEQELQEFLDRIMRESAEKHKVPPHIVEDVLQNKEAEAAQELTPPVEEAESAPESPAPLRRAEHEQEPETVPAAQTAAAHPLRDGIAGVILVLMALIGLLGMVQCGIFWCRRLSEHHADPRIAQVEKAVLPLVLIDQADFDTPDALTDEQFLTAAVWMLIADGKLAQYPENFEMREIPAADVTAAGNQRFGTSRTPAYKTIGFTGDLRFYYDAQTGHYLVPGDPHLFTYIPEIVQLEDTDAGTEALVRYLAEQPAWKNQEPQTVKTVAYTLVLNGTDWQVRKAAQIS